MTSPCCRVTRGKARPSLLPSRFSANLHGSSPITMRDGMAPGIPMDFEAVAFLSRPESWHSQMRSTPLPPARPHGTPPDARCSPPEALSSTLSSVPHFATCWTIRLHTGGLATRHHSAHVLHRDQKLRAPQPQRSECSEHTSKETPYDDQILFIITFCRPPTHACDRASNTVTPMGRSIGASPHRARTACSRLRPLQPVT